MSILYCDFETRSECDLIARGAYNYSLHGTTEVLCMAYAFDDEEVQVWTPDQPFPARVRAHKGQIRAHNAAFERLIFWHVLEIPYALEQFYCTATQARANCAPGSLEDVGRFAGADMKKDHRGAALVRKCCCPPFKHTEQDLQDLFEYCAQDVRAMRAISKALRDLSAQELADYHVNERINDRGVLVDTALCRAAMRYAETELVEIQQIVTEVTQGALTSVRSPKMREWVWERVGPQARKLMTVHKDGETKQSIDKSVRGNLLALAEENADEVPTDVAEVIQCADDLWASSTAKFARLADLADEEDGRIRGAFVFAGGSATGRASSYGAQVHNFPRKAAKAAEEVRTAVVRGHKIVPTYGKRVTDVLKSMLRPALVPTPGHVFIVADWSAIEGRVHPWLSNCPAGEAKLDVFRAGRDPYIVNAAATFGTSYEAVLADHEAGRSDQRQIGKVQELALGFLGGPGAFATFGRIYGVRVTEADAQKMVNAWRRANPWAMAHGQALESAYLRAMRHPGHEFSAGRVAYLYDRQHLWYVLPSGRVLCYPYARLEDGEVTYAKAAWTPAADAKEWPRARLWRGLACIAKDTPVLTKRGWVPIQKVQASDPVWDGVDWVRHDGVAHQGFGRVSYVFGVAMTADHLVLTKEGWKRADEAERHIRAACRLPLRHRMGWFGRAALHLADYLRLRSDAGDEASELHEVGTRRSPGVMRMQESGIAVGSYTHARHESASSVCGMAVYARSLPVALSSSMEKLRGAWHHSMRTLAGVFRKFLGRHGADVSARFVFGSYQQQRPVLARQLSVGDLSRAGAEQAQFAHGGQPAGPHVGLRTVRAHRYRPDDAAVPDKPRSEGRGFDSFAERCSEVFDLINCGPRRRFVVRGLDGRPLIVHNCENITQAVANDVLRHALRSLDNVVLHVHDEIVLEVPQHQADQAVDRLQHTMRTAPEWATGLPLDCEVKRMTRYGK